MRSDASPLPASKALYRTVFTIGLAILVNGYYYQPMSNTNTCTKKHREVAIELGDCRSCQGCIDLNPDVFQWDEALDMPYVSRSEVTEDEVRDIMNSCPEGCIVFVD